MVVIGTLGQYYNKRSQRENGFNVLIGFDEIFVPYKIVFVVSINNA